MYRFLLTLLFMVMAWTSYSTHLFAAPRVSVGETSYDFGIINQGQLVTSSFSIGNTGTEPLLIERIEFSMPGMNARVKQHIEPQEKTQINVTWDTSRFRREIMGQATLYINDPAVPQIILSLSGTVIPDIEFLPRPAFYFSQFAGENHSQSITLKNNQDHPLELTGFSTASNNFDYQFKEVDAGKVFELAVSVKPDAPAGRFRDSLVIKTSDPKHPSLHLEVNILVKSGVYISEEMIDFGTVNLSRIKENPGIIDFLQQTFTINRKAGNMTITDADASIDFLDVTIQPETPSNIFKVDVGLKPDQLKAGKFNGSLTLKTNDPEHPELVIAVTGYITD